MAKGKYVTDDYIEKVEHYLYNNLPLSDLEDVSDTLASFNKEVVKEIVKKGEEWVQLPEFEHVILTSTGRFINTYKIRQYSVRFSPNTMHMYISSKKIKAEEIFQEQGWEFDVKKIKAKYKKNNWAHNDYTDSFKK